MNWKTDWCSCDGHGQSGSPRGPVEPQGAGASSFRHGPRGSTEEREGPSRRSLISLAGMGALGWAARGSALAQVAMSPTGDQGGNVLVVIFLRGGMDGLSAVVPYGDDGYHRHRPTLGLSNPDNRTAAQIDRTLDLDGFFGLHPALGPLLPLFREGRLGVVHAIGSDDRTRSHFEAMNAMERGVATAKGIAPGGWLARYLEASPAKSPSPLRAIALTSVMPDSLRGATHALALESLDAFRLEVPANAEAAAFRRSLAQLYARDRDLISQAGHETLQVLGAIEKLDPSRYLPSGGAKYPEGDLGTALKQVAFLIKGRLGLEVACLDKGGWDTHFGQGRSSGLLTGLLSELGQSLAAFAADLGSDMSRVTVVAMTEFGRRVYENSTLGTDHGRGSVMLLMGGGVKGGKVHGAWPGLGDADLEQPGDLRVTTDYRSVLSEVLARRMGFARTDAVFPGFSGGVAGVLG